ncbi:MAG: RNA polymerase sigma factor [Gammaproteobacteria bacterium]|nr:RNA polymerase sigma factor [Gammaproteobacteria bacterium]
MRAVSDEQLIEWVAQGDSSCLGTLFERHNRSVFQFCRQMTRNNAHAEDLVQEIFLKILKKAGSYRRQGSFRAWMFNIARNLTLDQIRKAKRRRDLVPVDDSIEANPVDYRSAEVAAASSQKMGVVVQALANLPIAVQEVIWLGRFEFDNYEELGQALDCKPATARVRMHRAMQQLNAEFEAINGAPIDV